jgi:hypothetical protein
MNYMSELAQGLVDEILTVVHKYDESMLLPTVLGCLDIAKLQLLQEHMEEDDDEH